MWLGTFKEPVDGDMLPIAGSDEGKVHEAVFEADTINVGSVQGGYWLRAAISRLLVDIYWSLATDSNGQ